MKGGGLGVKTFDVRKKMCKVRIAVYDAKKELREKIVLTELRYGADSSGIREDRHTLDVLKLE